MFDATQFSDEVAHRYGLRIPRLAVLGLAEQLEQDGLLECVSGQATKAVYKYPPAQQIAEEEVPAVTELEIDNVLTDFVAICRTDEILENLDDEALHKGFLERLLHTDSMQLLSRREAKPTTKRTVTTLTREAQVLDSDERRELRLDFHVAQFLLDGELLATGYDQQPLIRPHPLQRCVFLGHQAQGHGQFQAQGLVHAFGKGRVFGVTAQGQVAQQFFLAYGHARVFPALADQAGQAGNGRGTDRRRRRPGCPRNHAC